MTKIFFCLIRLIAIVVMNLLIGFNKKKSSLGGFDFLHVRTKKRVLVNQLWVILIFEIKICIYNILRIKFTFSLGQDRIVKHMNATQNGNF